MFPLGFVHYLNLQFMALKLCLSYSCWFIKPKYETTIEKRFSPFAYKSRVDTEKCRRLILLTKLCMIKSVKSNESSISMSLCTTMMKKVYCGVEIFIMLLLMGND